MPRSLAAWARGDVPATRLAAARNRCADAYDRIESLPRGGERRAAWAAYALVTYADKLVAAARTDGYVDGDTADVVLLLLELAARGDVPAALPHWPAGSRTEHQLHGMHGALDALRTFIAFDLPSEPRPDLELRLAGIDRRLQKVATLWIPRPTPAIRGGIADALAAGLDEAYALGLVLAL